MAISYIKEMDMKQHVYILTLSVAATLAALSACGDDSSTGNHAEEPENAVPMDSVATDDDLPSCTEKRQESVAFVEDDSSIRICLDEKWEEAESVAATREDLPNCSDKRKGVSAYVLDEHGFLTCTDGRWKSDSKEPESSEAKSSSSKKTDKSSSSGEKNSSGSEKVSSAKDESSSSAEAKSSSSDKGAKSSSSSKGTSAKNSLTATIYDTDATLHPAFSCYQSNPGAAASEGCQTGAQGTDSKIAIKAATDCSGIIQGIVETSLGSDKKPVLTEAGEKCFIEDKFFNQLFNYTEGVNEAVAWEMPFPKNDNGIWMFNSDSTIDGTKIGGFFPIENTTDDDILTVGGKKLGPLADARTKRDSESPYFINDSVDFYHYCKGPGWTDGVEDCGGSFMSLSDHQEFYNMLYGNTHWRENRNHHFCMEIHGTFTYSDTLEAGFSASGDQWVFIGNKLAVDNGGTHVNAPGFVQMKELNKTYSSFMKEGEKYPIDVFFCARRTSLSDFSMWTNFPITQE